MFAYKNINSTLIRYPFKLHKLKQTYLFLDIKSLFVDLIIQKENNIYTTTKTILLYLVPRKEPQIEQVKN